MSHRQRKANPEFFLYEDKGCEAGGPSCLRCPLPECVEVVPWSVQQRMARVAQVRETFAQGASVRTIAERLALTPSMVQRIVKPLRDGNYAT